MSQIKKALTDKGYTDAQAEAEIAILRDKVCRAEPTAAMLAGTTADDMIAAGVAPAAARAIGAMLAGPKVDKGKRYKPGRTYTAIEFAEHYERDAENVDLVADITRATDGKRWVIAPAGKFNAAESARYIQWHMDEDVAPATVLVNGAPIAPVMPGEERKKAAKLYHVDPFTAGAFLDVTMTSERTKASFVGYTDEALSAMAFLYERELRGEGALALRKFADEMRGKEPADILGTGETRAAWDANPKTRPAAKREKAGPFAEPTTQNPAAGAVGPVPSWLTAIPLNWADKAGIAFRNAVAETIPDARPIALRLGIAGWVNLSSTPRNVWHDVFHVARNANKHEALWAAIGEMVPALCAPEPAPAGTVPTIHILGAEYEPGAAAKIRTHLAARIKSGALRVTTDRDVVPGGYVADEKARMLREATLVAVLVSADTMATLDVPTGKRLVPVIVRVCDWQAMLGNLTPLPRSGKADSEEAWAEVAAGLAAAAI